MSAVATPAEPFLDESFHIRWSLLVPEEIESNISKALEISQKNIDDLANWDGESELAFENTLMALEKASESLDRGWGALSHLDSVRNSEAQREAYNKMLPAVTEFSSRVTLNDGLWSRVKAYSQTDEAKSLTGAKKRLLEETILDFTENGADLPPEEKSRLEEVQAVLATLTQKFSENVLDSMNAWELIIEDESRLAGLPPTSKAVLLSEAREKDLGTEEKPVWRVTLKQPVYFPVLEHADDETLRKEVWEGSCTVGKGGDFDNTDLIWKILSLRQDMAGILGKKDFAAQVLNRRMAKNGAAALDFVEDLHEKTKPFFRKDIEELEAFVAEQTGNKDKRLNPWDVAYWSEKQRKAKYDFDEEETRPYFPIDGVLEGMFRLTEQVFGFKVEEKKSVFVEPGKDPASDDAGFEVWHPEVKYYTLHDEKSGDHLGSFYADWHPRDSKRPGAWMNYLRTGKPPVKGGDRKPHLGLICGNMTPSSKDKPALLTHSEVETVFHEFGHLLHHLLGEVEIKSLNGVNVVWDFVELPSQIMENFCWSRVGLDFFAKHFETGEKIPDELFDKMIAARNYQSGMAQMRQLSLGKMDLELHVNHHSEPEGSDLDSLVQGLLEGYMMDLEIRPPSMARRFGHLFSSPTGYAAGYYSYKWAEVLDADAFTKFADAGVISPEVGREFREKILSRGNSQAAADLFRDFMGRDPDLNALLKRSGLSD